MNWLERSRKIIDEHPELHADIREILNEAEPISKREAKLILLMHNNPAFKAEVVRLMKSWTDTSK